MSEKQHAMPVNKDAMSRYRIIDKMLADSSHDYTTGDILDAVLKECPHVSLRMIQKDIKAFWIIRRLTCGHSFRTASRMSPVV